MSIRRIFAVSALAVVAPVTLIAGSAQAAVPPVSTISASASDTTPASGQTFSVTGTFIAQGVPADHDLVKVQSLTAAGTWVPVTGAHVDTTSTGIYQLRLILSATGVRDLRVVGVVPGPSRDAFKRFAVTVH